MDELEYSNLQKILDHQRQLKVIEEQITDLIGVSEEQAALLHSINDTLRQIKEQLRA